jgi:hypothetical protein
MLCITLFKMMFILFIFFSCKSNIRMNVFQNIKLSGMLQGQILNVSLLFIFYFLPYFFFLPSFHTFLLFFSVNIAVTLTVIQMNELYLHKQLAECAVMHLD